MVCFSLGVFGAYLAIKETAQVTISDNTIARAEILCKENGGTFSKMLSTISHDEIYCKEGFKIVAKKDGSQNMWTNFEVVRPESIKD
jgi:hypothetical protein